MRFFLLGFLIILSMLICGCDNSQGTNLSSTEKLQQEKVLNDPAYINANEATKEAIRQKYKIQPRIVKMPDGTELHFPAGTSESVINNVVQKYKTPLREVKMPDGTIVKNIPIGISDTEVFERYRKSLTNDKQLQLDESKSLKEAADKDFKFQVKEFEANLNKSVPQPPPINYPTDLAGIENEFHRIKACNVEAEKTTNKFKECSDAALKEEKLMARARESVCLSSLYIEKYETYCDGFSNSNFLKIADLYTKAMWADMPLPNDEKYQAIKKQIEVLKIKAHQDYLKYISTQENIISKMKLAVEETNKDNNERRKRNEYIDKLKADIAEGESRREMNRAIVDGLNANQPKNSVIQMQGGPPIYCKTVKNYTSCGYMPSY